MVHELPPVDMFETTADPVLEPPAVTVQKLPPMYMLVRTMDPVLEPPIVTVNIVLSLMAVDYPANKLVFYVSDDGRSPLSFYAIVEASKFDKLWIPFCKKYNVQG
ncbi:hypothetical protein Dsin_022100 [Dipteronia sinensis]|uniref:Cellulose synthase n=1 Tax=Dipteronia sinensis TaxID=43782 RepID=A0AAE0DZE6_9ROSI|nr:hypothetical protein Dsin_022100 [Dipteronia sinensis]